VPSSLNWSETSNWSGGVAPSGSVGTLEFPALPDCPGTATCYYSGNDISGTSANEISIDDGVPVDVGLPTSEQAITLGAGGLTAAPSTNDNGSFARWGIPLTLGADQTWSITGGAKSEGLMTVKLTQTGRRLLNRAQQLDMIATASFTPTGGSTVTRRKSFRLRR
jgi:hypothetical protein